MTLTERLESLSDLLQEAELDYKTMTLAECLEDLSDLLRDLGELEESDDLRQRILSISKAVKKFTAKEKAKEASAKKAGLVKGYEVKGGKRKKVFGRWVRDVNPDPDQPVFITKRR